MSTTAKKQTGTDISAVDKQIRRVKAMLHEPKSALENLEDRRERAAAKKRHVGKPDTSLRDAARELEL